MDSVVYQNFRFYLAFFSDPVTLFAELQNRKEKRISKFRENRQRAVQIGMTGKTKKTGENYLKYIMNRILKKNDVI